MKKLEWPELETAEKRELDRRKSTNFTECLENDCGSMICNHHCNLEVTYRRQLGKLGNYDEIFDEKGRKLEFVPTETLKAFFGVWLDSETPTEVEIKVIALSMAHRNMSPSDLHRIIQDAKAFIDEKSYMDMIQLKTEDYKEFYNKHKSLLGDKFV